MCRQLAASLAQREAECEALRVGTVGGMQQHISELSEELAQRSAQLADLQGSHADLQQQMAAATAQLEQEGSERRALQAAYEGKVRQSLSCGMSLPGSLDRVLSAEPCKQPAMARYVPSKCFLFMTTCSPGDQEYANPKFYNGNG